MGQSKDPVLPVDLSLGESSPVKIGERKRAPAGRRRGEIRVEPDRQAEVLDGVVVLVRAAGADALEPARQNVEQEPRNRWFVDSPMEEEDSKFQYAGAWADGLARPDERLDFDQDGAPVFCRLMVLFQLDEAAALEISSIAPSTLGLAFRATRIN